MINQQLDRLRPILELIRRYIVTIAIVIVGATYAYLIYTSGSLASSQPSDSEVTNSYKSASSPKIDPVIVDKLSELQDSNIRYQSLIDEARKNPFEE